MTLKELDTVRVMLITSCMLHLDNWETLTDHLTDSRGQNHHCQRSLQLPVPLDSEGQHGSQAEEAA